MATEILCLYLADDEKPVDALRQAIESDDSPELVRVQPFEFKQQAGMWVRENLVNTKGGQLHVVSYDSSNASDVQVAACMLAMLIESADLLPMHFQILAGDAGET